MKCYTKPQKNGPCYIYILPG